MRNDSETNEKPPMTEARERVVADLKTLTRDAEDLLNATAGEVSEKTKEVRERFGEALKRAKSTCQDMQEETTATMKMAAQKADVAIREHPYQSVGAAFGAGLLIGVLLMRK